MKTVYKGQSKWPVAESNERGHEGRIWMSACNVRKWLFKLISGNLVGHFQLMASN